ncbi:hypothetical protein RB2150_10229 [Rhodobacterales bacterium HTCC2150]|nr:hypothetical protein RB2150_10229 [Rhodobacterales bacterium HTCC2150] [Rhodobacteraceae bacterium HTCC2150]
MSGSATAGIDRSLSEAQFSADAMCRLRLLGAGAGAANWRFVRKADIWAECSEGLLPAISTSGGVAAKLRFRVCSGGHAGAYGADVVKDIFWILNK